MKVGYYNKEINENTFLAYNTELRSWNLDNQGVFGCAISLSKWLLGLENH